MLLEIAQLTLLHHLYLLFVELGFCFQVFDDLVEQGDLVGGFVELLDFFAEILDLGLQVYFPYVVDGHESIVPVSFFLEKRVGVFFGSASSRSPEQRYIGLDAEFLLSSIRAGSL